MLDWLGSPIQRKLFHFEESQLGPGNIGGKIFWNSKKIFNFFYCYNFLNFSLPSSVSLQASLEGESIQKFCRNIRLAESNAKGHYLKNFTCKGTLRQVFTFLRPPPLLDFCSGRSSNFVGSESGQKHILYIDFGKGGGVGGRWTREKVRGAIVGNAGSKIPTWLAVSTVYKLY